MMLMPVVLLLVVTPCVLAKPWFFETPPETAHLFQGFKMKYSKTYQHKYEEDTRRDIFALNLIRIRDHNKLYDLGVKTYFLAINQFADMTHEEFQQSIGFWKPIKPSYTKRKTDINASHRRKVRAALPEEVDWRLKGYVTSVKNQTGSLEGQHAKKYGKLVSLSDQQLLDCSGTYGNQGCNGGLMEYAFDYIKGNNGIAAESRYPYEATQGACRYSSKDMQTTCSGYVNIESGSESDLQDAVANIGPISAAIDSGSMSFQLYAGGVYNEPGCSSSKLDHGVLVVGYGTDSGTPYWLVKNSWGVSWGDAGYIKMSRNQNNQCGIATDALYPTIG